MYSKRVAFQIHQQEKNEEIRENSFKFSLSFLSLIAYAMSLQHALKIVSSVHPGQLEDAILTNQSARFTQVVL